MASQDEMRASTRLREVHAAEERLEAGIETQPPLFLGFGTTGK